MVSSPQTAIATTPRRAIIGGFGVSGWQGYGYWFMRGAPGPADSA